MKIAVSGKGGVGKTTIAALIALSLARRGYNVLAVDADPSPNLALALGVEGPEARRRLKPIALNVELIKEKTGVEPGSYGAYFRLSFRVDDIVERFSAEGPEGIRLIVMGRAERAGEGCMCPANAVLRALMRHLVVERGEAVVMDMEAGVEHLKRGTAEHVDALLVVTEPYRASLSVSGHIIALARELGIKKIYVIGNKVRTKSESESLDRLAQAWGASFVIPLPYDPLLAELSLRGEPLTRLPRNSPFLAGVESLVSYLEEELSGP